MCGFGALMDAAELVSATRAPSNDAALAAVARRGMSRVLDRSITPSFPCKFRPLVPERIARGTKLEQISFLVRPRGRFSVPTTNRWACRARRRSRSGGAQRRDRPGGAAGVLEGVRARHDAVWVGGSVVITRPPQRRRRQPGVAYVPAWIVALARHHHLPGDARRFVGQRDRRELGRLALQQRPEPGRTVPALGLTCRMTEVAPQISSDLSVSSPARVIPPCLTLPPLE